MRLAELSGRRTASLAAFWLFGAPVLILLGLVLPSIVLEELPAIGPCTLDIRVGSWLGWAIIGPPLALIAAWLGVRRRQPEAGGRAT